MRTKLIISIALFLLLSATYAQSNSEITNTISLLSTFNMNTDMGLPVDVSNESVYSFSDFYFQDNKVVFLCNFTHKIRTVDTKNSNFLTEININHGCDLFTICNNNFYTIQNKKIVVTNFSGTVVNEVLLPTSFISPVKIFTENDKIIVWNYDQSSAIFDVNSLSKTPVIIKKSQYLGNGITGSIKKLDSFSYFLKYNDENGEVNKKTIVSEEKLGSIRIVGIAENNIVIDKETIITEVPLKVKREIVLFNYKEPLAEDITIELPNIYYTYIKEDLKIFDGDIYYFLSTPEQAKLFSIDVSELCNVEKTSFCLPDVDYSYIYHYNNYLIEADDSENDGYVEKGNRDGSIYRSEVIAIAKTFEEHIWYANANNIGYVNEPCGSALYTTPEWIVEGMNQSIPYKWGGFSSLDQYEAGLLEGDGAGDKNTSSVAYTCCVGLDCSGFVSRAWNQSSKYGTSTIGGISTAYASFDDLLPGDAVNNVGSHIRLVYALNENSTVTVLEATGSGWIVKYNTYTYTSLQANYIPIYYNQIEEDVVMPPELISPIQLASDVSVPVNFDWTENEDATIYTIQVALSDETWDATNGFSTSSSPDGDVPVNYETGNITNYLWTSYSEGIYCAPTPNTEYYWSVRCFVPGEGYSVYTHPRKFVSQADNTAPETDFTINLWETEDFTVNFDDTDNYEIKYRFYSVADNNYISDEWRSNGNNGFFNDNFDLTEIHADWTTLDGTWDIVDNSLNQNNETLTNNNAYVMVEQTSSNAYLYNWKMKISGSGSARRAGIYIFCDEPEYTQRNNAYMVYFRADDNKCQIYKSVDDDIALQTNDDCTVNADVFDDYKVMYDPQTGKIDAFINDVLVSTWTDLSPLQSGNSISLRTGAANVYFDQFKVYKSRSDEAEIILGEDGDIRYSNPNPDSPAGIINSIVIDYANQFSSPIQKTLNIDTSIPEDIGYINDGTDADIDETFSLIELSANWSDAIDVNSEILEYEYAIGTNQGLDDIVSWTSCGTETSVVHSGLSLTHNTMYYFSVRATNGANLLGNILSSNGQLVLDPMSLSKLNENDDLTIYPNPANAKIKIESNIEGNIELLDTHGQVVITINSTSENTTIDISELSNDVYILKAQTKNGFVLKKIIKQ